MAGLRRAGLMGFLLALQVSACGGGGGGDPKVAHVEVAITSPSLEVGATAQAAAVLTGADGSVLSGRAVTWESSASSVATVGADGVVSALKPGAVRITATSEGVAGHVDLVVTPGPLAQLLASAGDWQTAAPGAALAVAPQVQAVDAYGDPIGGVEVTFAIASGDGAILVSQAMTDAEGHASCGAWTLGATPGLQALTATAPSSPATRFSAVAVRTSADVTVTLLSPTGVDHRVDRTFRVAASVQSTYQLASISATAGGDTITLTQGMDDKGYPAWVGDVSGAGLPLGRIALVVTAKDVFGNTADAVRFLLLDPYPRLDVSAPVAQSLARPTAEVAATCFDEGESSCAVTVSASSGTLVSGTGAVDAVLDLSTYEGRSVDLVFKARDRANQVTQLTRRVYVESSPRLERVATVPGLASSVWDYATGRVLYLDAGISPPALCAQSLATQTVDLVDTGAGLAQAATSYGYLTAAGAIYSDACALREWVPPAPPIDLGALNSCISLQVAGSYALYSQGTTLVRRDLAAQTIETVSTSAGNISNSVAVNGLVAFWSSAPGYDVYTWRDGVTRRLTEDGSASTMNIYPVTDGTFVVYRKAGPARLALHDGTTERLLTLDPGGDFSPGRGYAIANGVVAYLVHDATGPDQIWRDGPGGEEQVTFFGVSSTIEALGDDGTVLFAKGGRRFLVLPGETPQEIGSTLGRAVFRDGAFYVLLGNSVLRVVP